jgi:hypothetical protein
MASTTCAAIASTKRGFVPVSPSRLVAYASTAERIPWSSNSVANGVANAWEIPGICIGAYVYYEVMVLQISTGLQRSQLSIPRASDCAQERIVTATRRSQAMRDTWVGPLQTCRQLRLDGWLR